MAFCVPALRRRLLVNGIVSCSTGGASDEPGRRFDLDDPADRRRTSEMALAYHGVVGAHPSAAVVTDRDRWAASVSERTIEAVHQFSSRLR
jgi:hypothetical protein